MFAGWNEEPNSRRALDPNKDSKPLWPTPPPGCTLIIRERIEREVIVTNEPASNVIRASSEQVVKANLLKSIWNGCLTLLKGISKLIGLAGA